MTRLLAAEALESATHIIRERQKTHGSPEATHARIAVLFTAFLDSRFDVDVKLMPSDVAQMLALMKLARDHSTGEHNPDNALDQIAYVALAAELKSSEQT